MVNVRYVGVTGNDEHYGAVATWIGSLPREVKVGNYLFKFVTGGGVTVNPFVESGYVSDHDFMIVNDSTDTVVKEAQMLMGDRCITVDRPYKFEYQTNLFLSAKKLAPKGLKIEVMLPCLWNSSSEIRQDGRIDYPDGCTHVIFKSMSGAVGEDQCIVPVNQVGTFASGHRDYDVKDLEAKFPEVVFFWSDSHKNVDGSFKEGVTGFMQRAWMALPYLTEVESEYRLLVGGDVGYLYLRTRRKENGHDRILTSNMSVVESSNYPDYVKDEIEFANETGISMSSLLEFAHKANIYTGSVDLYIREVDGKKVVGVFECCSQYGTTYVPIKVQKALSTGFATHCAKRFVACEQGEGK